MTKASYTPASNGVVMRVSSDQTSDPIHPLDEEQSLCDLILDLLGYDVMRSSWTKNGPIQRYKITASLSLVNIGNSPSQKLRMSIVINSSVISYTFEDEEVKVLIDSLLRRLLATIRITRPAAYTVHFEISGNLRDCGQHGIIRLAHALDVAREAWKLQAAFPTLKGMKV